MPIRLMGYDGCGMPVSDKRLRRYQYNLFGGRFYAPARSYSVWRTVAAYRPDIEELGTRFPDMSEVYNKGLRQTIRAAAKALV